MAQSRHCDVVVTGAGIGGLTAAHRLRRRASRQTRILLVDPGEHFVFAPDLLWLLAGTRRPSQFTKPMARMIPKGIDHHVASVTGFDPDAHTVRTTAGDIGYRKLIVALGSGTAPPSLGGFVEAAHDIYSIEGAQSARDALASITTGRIVIFVSRMPFKCPAAPYEAAFITDHTLRKRGVRNQVSVDVVTPELWPMPTAGAAMGHRVAAMLAERGIGFHPGTSVESIDASSRQLVVEGGAAVDFDVLLGVPPHHPPPVLAASPLAGPSGYAPVDPRTLASNQADVYVIGDAAALQIPDGKFLPKAGVFAHAEGKIVADRIVDELAGRTPTSEFNGDGSCFVELGGKRAARAAGNFTTSPPDMHMNAPGWWWHAAKVGLEKYWLNPILWR